MLPFRILASSVKNMRRLSLSTGRSLSASKAGASLGIINSVMAESPLTG
jgi:hypothetical protein